MLTFRRTVLVALAVLSLFLLFGGRNSLSAKRLFRDQEIEQRLVNAERSAQDAIRELQQSTNDRASRHEDELRRLQTQKRILEKQIQELRRLPNDVGVAHQLAYQFPYTQGHDKFPAYIWQTWKVGYDDPALDENIRQNFESWRRSNEGFVHEVLTDKEAHQLVRHLFMNIPAVVEAYEAMPEPILRADFFRYLILLARGGVYSDADTENLKPVPVWIPASFNPLELGLVIGIEADPDRPDWADWYARRLQFCQWTIQAKAGHPVLRDIVANITETTLDLKKQGKLALSQSSEARGTSIMDWTGPGIWTDTVFKYLNDIQDKSKDNTPVVDWHVFTGLTSPARDRDVLVLPITSFSPGIETMGAQSPNDPLAYVHHKFEGSWKPESERHIGE